MSLLNLYQATNTSASTVNWVTRTTSNSYPDVPGSSVQPLTSEAGRQVWPPNCCNSQASMSERASVRVNYVSE